MKETTAWVIAAICVAIIFIAIATACAATSINHNHDKADIQIACIEQGLDNCTS